MVNTEENKENWQKWYLETASDAAVGRLFKGLIHNLNGNIQAFSMQAELLKMTFSKSINLTQKAIDAGSLPEKQESLSQLKELLLNRAPIIKQMDDKIEVSTRTLARTLQGANYIDANNIQDGHSLREIIDTEIEFLSADSFFKHKIKKNISIDMVSNKQIKIFPTLNQVIFILLENCLDNLKGQTGFTWGDSPEVKIITKNNGKKTELLIHDNGPLIPGEIQKFIFHPFFSTRKNQHGLGLFLTKQLIKNNNCEIDYLILDTKNTFRLSFWHTYHS
jgi:signal transduction histidine kinase